LPVQLRQLAPAEVRVRFADTDAMGVVHHANYLAYFEIGRVDAMRQIGVEYASVVQRGVHLVVVDATVRYRQPAFFDDLLLVDTHATDVGGVRFAFVYEIRRDKDGVVVASGQTVHAGVDAHTLRPVRLPDWLRSDLLRLSTLT
jgi:acyl-CoA thioester hydrolase